ncbi:hypothetical protein Tco_0597684 [Tanacetum coccineum]
MFIPPPVDRREDIPEAELPPRKRLCLTALTSRYEEQDTQDVYVVIEDTHDSYQQHVGRIQGTSGRLGQEFMQDDHEGAGSSA